MAFYKAGTVSVTNGNAKVTGAGTAFVTGAPIGTIFQGPDKGLYEIVNVPSDTELTIDPPYGGATAGGQAYKIIPTTQYLADAAARMADLITGMAAVRDGIGQGLISAGTVALPGIRFTADQDTGIYRPGENVLGIAAGGVAALLVGATSMAPAGHVDMTAKKAIGLLASSASFTIGDTTTVATYGVTFGVGINAGGPATVLSGFGGVILATGNAERVRVDQSGNVGIGTTAPDVFSGTVNVHIKGSTAALATIEGGNCKGQVSSTGNFGMIVGTTSASPLLFYANNAERGRIDVNGNLQINASGAAYHVIRKPVPEGSIVLSIDNGTNGPVVYGANSGGASGAATCLSIPKNSGTGRSLNAAGTINASGADYAEYMRKAKACGVLAKGQIVGIDADGRLTDRFSLAHSFVIKSTDPAYVGGDSWSPGPPPAEPLLVLPAYEGPTEPTAPAGVARELPAIGDRPTRPVQENGEEMMDFILRMARWITVDAAWVAAMDARPAEVEALAIATAADEEAAARYAVDLPVWTKAMADHAADIAAAEQAHDAAMVQYAADKAAWDAEMERCRACVDRVAFSGQVPVNVAAGTFKPGDYMAAKAGKDDAIVGVVITNANMRLTPGLRVDAVGKVWRTMDDGRAWCAVLIG